VITTAKHSNVFYIYKSATGFEAVKKAVGVKNDFGLDLFRHNGTVYEGRTGVSLTTEDKLPDLAGLIDKNGGLPKIRELIEIQVSKAGESPRYTRPDERKADLFPPKPKNENVVFAKDGYGKKHYYYRFYNENGVELFTLLNAKEAYRTVFVPCEGYMLGVDQHHRLEELLKWLAGLENGIKGEVERIFNESMTNPQRWADPCFAAILGCTEEAERHNAPIREAREQENRQRDAEREAKRVAEEQARQEKYGKAIKEAENKILNRQAVQNSDVKGDKSLIMQLFREHDIAVPLKTQGWIINSLHDIYYHEGGQEWSYHYTGRPSTVFESYMARLDSAIQTKAQYEEMTQNACLLDGDIENDCADCIYAGDYHFQDGDCVERGDDENGDDMEI
jgi:hypothetical protein